MVLQLRVQLEEEDAHLEEDDGAGVEEQVPDPHHHLDVQAADRGGGGNRELNSSTVITIKFTYFSPF